MPVNAARQAGADAAPLERAGRLLLRGLGCFSGRFSGVRLALAACGSSPLAKGAAPAGAQAQASSVAKPQMMR